MKARLSRRPILALVYVLQIALAAAFIAPITQWVDDTLPGWFFYHLAPNEAAGPIGNPLEALFMAAGLPLGFYAALFLPVGMRMRVPGWMLALLAILNVPPVATLFLLGRAWTLHNAQ